MYAEICSGGFPHACSRPCIMTKLGELLCLDAVRQLSADGRLLFATKALRSVAYGATSVVLASYLVSLGLSDARCGARSQRWLPAACKGTLAHLALHCIAARSAYALSRSALLQRPAKGCSTCLEP